MSVIFKIIACFYAMILAVPIFADSAVDEPGKLKLYGDFRFRFEEDWDSHRSDGTQRDERTRVRIRGRLGLTYAPLAHLSFGARIRTGSRESQQSPHITIYDFEGNDTSDRDVILDKLFVKGAWEHASVWLGRNSFPFWQQNEFFRDDDVTPTGSAFSFKGLMGTGEYRIIAGYFALPDGAMDFNGNLAAGQFVYSRTFGETDLTAAAGIFSFSGGTTPRFLRNGNGKRDYAIWVAGIQAKRGVAGRPLAMGLDLMHNSKNYSSSDSDPFTAANYDQTLGYVLSARWGKLKKKGDWLVGYYYAHIETFAVNASYAQDDWLRWGSATQTDSSNLKGHEIRVAYAFNPTCSIVARLYSVDAITSSQDGKRFRIDLNYKF